LSFPVIMRTKYLIIGQGIAGTLLSCELYKAGKDFLLLDNDNRNNASYTAAAIINPLGGKHWKPVEQGAIIIEKALEVYKALDGLLDCSFVQSRELYYFPQDGTDLSYFIQQQKLLPACLSMITDTSVLRPYFNMPYMPGKIMGLWQVDSTQLLTQWHAFLKREQRLVTALFDHERLKVGGNGIEYDGINADKIIFCDGAAGINNPWLKHIPFTANRGDVLLLDIPDLPANALYEHKLRLVPYTGNSFWCGSNYQWKYKNLVPDLLWRKQAEEHLEKWLKLPYKVIDHKVAERPTTAGQKVFAGIHPGTSSIAYLNGLGTRGFSSGPLWAARLAAML